MKILSIIAIVLGFSAAASDFEALQDWIYATPEGSTCLQKETSVTLEDRLQSYTWTYRSEGSENTQSYSFYTFLCDFGAYNGWYLVIERDEFTENTYRILHFAIPQVDFELEETQESETVKAWSLLGFSSTPSLINLSVNEDSQTLEAFTKWRGIGDAFDTNRYTFKSGVWLLSHAMIDPTFDGAINPITVFSP